MTAAPNDWFDAAACKGLDTNLFFPERGEVIGTVRDVCLSCPVQLECLTYALDLAIREGVWGGYSEGERRRMRKGRPRHTVCEFCAGRFVAMPGRNGKVPPHCSDECRLAHRRRRTAGPHRRYMQDRRAHARSVDSGGDDPRSAA